MHVFRTGLTRQVVWHYLRDSSSILPRDIFEKRVVISCDLRWPFCEPRSSVAPGSPQMWWLVLSLKEFDGFGWFMRNGKHFYISPLVYKREVTKLTWPWIIEIKISRYTFYRYLRPHAILQVSNHDATWTVPGHDVAVFFFFFFWRRFSWTDLTLGRKNHRMPAMNVP